MNEWRLKDLYKSDKELERDIKKIKKEAKNFQKNYKGKLEQLTPKEFIEALKEYENILNQISRAATYTFLKFAKNSDNGSFYANYSQKFSNIQEFLLFFELEFNTLDSLKQKEILKCSGIYKYYLQNLIREKKHQLSPNEEKILLKKSLTSSKAFSRLFDEHFSRMKFDFDGKKISEEEILSKLYLPDRDTRKKAANSLSKKLRNNLHLTSYIYNMIKTDLKIECELRRYRSVEEPRHIDNKITQKSVDALINTTSKNFHLVSQYYNIKREILGYDTLYDYDRYAPYVTNEDKIPFNEAKEMVLESFKNFSPKFYNIAKKAFKDGWCDIFPKDKKRGGAFSHPASVDTHPYIMLNYTNKRRDIFTIAHELGHAIHQYLSRDVGYLGSDTPLTTSETASVFAEMLLFDDMKKFTPKEELLALYGGKLEDIFATLFRQIIFTTFERKVHSKMDELSSDEFNEFWMEENSKMFQDSIQLTDGYKYWWSYIPHFIHTPFYCYAYSYGQLLVMALYGLYKKEGENFKKRYIKFLSSGGSKSPKALIKKFGFDIEDENFWQIGIDEVANLLKEFKELRK